MNPDSPTVVLVHGAFADASSWSSVTERLQQAGVSVLAVPNPLRQIASDGEYVASVARQIEGPVLLVGHSYGGPVITHAGARADNVRGVVYVGAFGLDQGQTINQATSAFPPPLLATSTEVRAYPTGDGSAPEVSIQRALFADVFAGDLPAERAAVLAASQRPLAAATFDEPLTVEPVWRTRPSWFLITTQDHAIHPDSQRDAARRMNATTTEVDASHAVALSQPETVTVFILKALEVIGNTAHA